MREMERILETEGIEARASTWEQLGYEVGLGCSGRTVQRAMGTMDYHKCVSCRKGSVNKKTAAHRVSWATQCLRNILSRRIGIMYDSAMRFISAGVLKENYESYENLEKDIVRIVFRRE